MGSGKLFKICFLCLLSSSLGLEEEFNGGAREFKIESNRFVKDGKPMLLKAGCIHYSRVPVEYWKDRLLRIRAMGLNAIQTYVPWNYHEERRGEINFEGDRDLIAFMKIAQDIGLLVILRAGPYMCGEWDFGGLPTWIVENGTIALRTYEEPYYTLASGWFRTILKKTEPLLYKNGGPIVMVQVENEYGSYGNVAENEKDRQYMEGLISVAQSVVGNDTILFTTDGGNLGYMQHGSINGSSVLTVGDGCGNVQQCWDAQAEMNPPGMSVNMVSEFYTGWLSHWTEKIANTSTVDVAKHLDSVLSSNGSVSLYMAHGGTSFGYWSGANAGNNGGNFVADITSYDYDAPIAEGGQHGFGSDGKDKYAALSSVLTKYWDPETDGSPTIPEEPPLPSPVAYGNGEPISMQYFTGMLSERSMSVLSPSSAAEGDKDPRPMGLLGCLYGFVLYRAVLSSDAAGLNLTIPGGPRDRAHVIIDSELQGSPIFRLDSEDVYLGFAAKKGATIEILVENIGRVNFGRFMPNDTKGIINGVEIDGKPLETEKGWDSYCITPTGDKLSKLTFNPVSTMSKNTMPVFFKTVIEVPGNVTGDSYLNMDGWGKGYVWVNGKPLGRYWQSAGPQRTLYVPAPFLQGTGNENYLSGNLKVEIVVLELDAVGSVHTIMFEKSPRFA